MANLKEIRNRITSVSSTMQITSAMKMVSAAKLKKAQDAITAMRPYAEKLTELLQNLSATLDGDAGGEFTKQREIKKVLVVAITSNRGLCGAFNTNVIKEVKNRADFYAGKQVDVFAIGKKGNDVLSKTLSVIDNQSSVFDALTFDNVAKIAQMLTDKFVAGEYDRIEVIYNQFKNAATQIVQTEQFLPLAPIKSDLPVSTGDYIFEPSKEEIVLTLIPKSLKTQLYKGIRDSFASEHGARMTAMHKATDNATELRDQLKLTYNKARQAAITNEILEIVGGAEALKG
ncbi:ATP synthase F1 subunit gamma [Flavobacterium psychrophilum]|jgi:F-type H+-transporting ATPase subunit gamma|uniref:ATP synthase gamma chain n=2 Tax=Flavobacterium psychrophilum TaxID=96345 RepID=ATPG_FLAPJ|nr:ATP synthase F1 subunit gamma [Flavobacterium psychrophilum]A6H2D6.1 RecName: Full=ATP synthase gamma chain; AltName: Full=ATP synthase F1 sector gamma subunit; AltName: Full=F-ATPase gamma subunit [Flavobacterium psychrophilum JIP02/86]AIG31179.1 ATP F0F1 synthase subunit gamma [Flavobacterium psychrophilum]AIG33456.1 ATP F0F1 synthase subunit gamma [Flavobacterium psychrophilum]AIG35607.1 ATP F0F1 synthase subunit gamma [Flavobacterium psychrophilum]AIG37967.1 ATP F0F1 synthase subunit ga